eukprot:6189599-Pleurochrysis_carterae.AAC.6
MAESHGALRNRTVLLAPIAYQTELTETYVNLVETTEYRTASVTLLHRSSDVLTLAYHCASTKWVQER